MIRIIVAIVVSLAVSCLSAFAQSKPTADYVTNFPTLFQNWGEFEEEQERVRQEQYKIEDYRGKAGKSASDLADVLDVVIALEERASKLVFYAILQRNVDTTSDVAQEAYDAATALRSRVVAASSFLTEEINQIPASRLRKWILENKRLAPYRVRLNAAIDLAPHRLNAEAESHLAQLARAAQVSPDVWTALMQTESLGWPTLSNAAAEVVVATPAAYRRYRRSLHTADRRNITRAHLNHLGELAEPIGLLYTRRIESDWTAARERGFQKGAHAWWRMTEHIPPGATEVMVEVARDNRDLLNRYAILRARALNIDDFEYGDFLAPVTLNERDYSVQETINRLAAAYKVFGPEWPEILHNIVKEPLLHLAPSAVKSSEWGILPGIGGSKPYLRMNYEGSYSDSRRLAAGLTSLITFYNRSPALKLSADDSAVGAGLYATYLLYDAQSATMAETDDEKIAFLIEIADRYWYSFFRNIVTIELDMRIETMIAQGENPTGAQVSATYLNLLREYYADVQIDDVYAYDWMTNFVPFLNYAHHNWPASMAAAAAVLDLAETGEDVSGAIFSEVTNAGNSDRGYEVLLEYGIDLRSPEPYVLAVRHFEAVLDDLQATLNRR